MATKPDKIDDVKPPAKVTPATTSRPIIVTSRPILTNDPMMKPADGEAEKPAEPIARTAKTIKPIDASLEAAAQAIDESIAKKAASEPAKPVVAAKPVPKATVPTAPEAAPPATAVPVAEATGTPSVAPTEPASDQPAEPKPEPAAEDAPASESGTNPRPQNSAVTEIIIPKEGSITEAMDEKAKAIAGVSSAQSDATDLDARDEAAAPTEPSEKPTAGTEPSNDDKAAKSEPAVDVEAKPAEGMPLGITGDGTKRDAAAAVSADEAAAMAAREAREQELEALAESGKYHVPINARQRKRSRINTMLLFLLAVVLGAVLFDAALDTGLVNVSVNLPHTHFFANH